MDVSLFDYHLPQDRIAQKSVEPRDQAKLLVADPVTQTLSDKHIFDLPDLIEPGDLLIFNDSKVFKARLHAKHREREMEIFLLRPEEDQAWSCLIKRSKRLAVGDELIFSTDLAAQLEHKSADGTCRIRFDHDHDFVFSFADQHGEIPTPPYVDTKLTDEAAYQTVYAKERGSVAAPTAGFHFTKDLLTKLQDKGVRTGFVTLHVGLGTFRPMKTETLDQHEMHEEWAFVSDEIVRMIEETKKAGHRIIAVGTTAVRALESAAQVDGLRAFSGFTKLFIIPGYQFHVIDGLITNFHLPKSTLLVLISAFAGREFVLRAYQYAIDHAYRFYSFGDAMFIPQFPSLSPTHLPTIPS